MYKKIIYISIVIALLIGAIMIVSATRQPNDYYAKVFDIVDFSPIGENNMSISYQVGYIPINKSESYIYERATLTTEINMSNTTTITPLTHETIKNYGTSKGYNVVSILYQEYKISTNFSQMENFFYSGGGETYTLLASYQEPSNTTEPEPSLFSGIFAFFQSLFL